MANRFERGKTPPYSPLRINTGGVKLAASFSLEEDTENIVLAGALYPIFTRQTDSTFLSCSGSLTLCGSGQTLARSTYSTLYNRIGTVWGSGNGTNTFNVPDFSHNPRYPCGLDNGPVYSGVGTYLKYSLDRHRHAYQQTTLFGYGDAEPYNQAPNRNYPAAPSQFSPAGSTTQTPVSTLFKTWVGNEDSGAELPVGTVIMCLLPDTVLASYLQANSFVLAASGQSIDVTAYPKWFAATGMTSLPDFRGFFIGMTDNTILPSATLYTTTSSVHGIHLHTMPVTGNNYVTTGGQDNRYRGGDVNVNTAGGFGGALTSAAYSISPGNETRPYNASITYLVKVK